MSIITVPHQDSAITSHWTPDELSLITETIAKGATPKELQLFLYRCRNMGLDPLKPGQIYFIKYGTSAGTIVVGIEGFRSKAAKTGMLSGIKRGVLRDKEGYCIGAWAEVYRKDWNEPAREEVSLREYDTGKGNWTKMPETMIKKVAEAAALRMAFPDDLGGVYASEEMDQADAPPPVAPPAPKASMGPAPQAEVSSPTVKPVIKTRAALGAEILKLAAQLELPQSEMDDWIYEEFKKPKNELTIPELETFKGILMNEVGRNGVVS